MIKVEWAGYQDTITIPKPTPDQNEYLNNLLQAHNKVARRYFFNPDGTINEDHVKK